MKISYNIINKKCKNKDYNKSTWWQTPKIKLEESNIVWKYKEIHILTSIQIGK